ncbi:probable receptor-like protein kinase At2g23200 [Cucumis sativus]|uniref:probable receptor-like protein kinase At2g23200 n=1 Tax=Cucumis sativus TaxID=3659 RepID=UPI0012F51051|nr:probable receptor-like protein kinase At2g23200 [Cucumis sativus]
MELTCCRWAVDCLNSSASIFFSLSLFILISLPFHSKFSIYRRNPTCSVPTISMEMVSSSDFHTLFSHIFLCLLFFSLHVQSYTSPDKYFVNCGSQTTVFNAGRSFIGDLNTTNTISFRFIPHNSGQVVDHSTESPSLYDSIRIFKDPSFYEFEVDQDTVHIVRLHFSPFNFSTDLSTSVFNVSASGFLLLRNFNSTNIRNNSTSIEEFFLCLNSGENFRIYFSPNSSSIAYVNAIEVFPIPPNFIPDKAKVITLAGEKGESKIFPSLVLHTIYRINVGGPEILPDTDGLWGKWEQEQDNTYLLNPSSAKNSIPHRTKLKFLNEDDHYFAPELVYQTAKELINSSLNSINITWHFPSRKHTRHLLRLHFYDLIDFLVNCGEDGFISVSVSPHPDTLQSNAFLNGVEIMEAMDEHTKDPVVKETKNKRVGVFVGLAFGIFGLICILGFGIYFGLKWRKPKSEKASQITHTKWYPLPVFGGGSTHSKFTERTSSNSPIPNLNLGLKFSLAEIKTATNNFNKKFLVGEGGFGKVYKGVMRNGMRVAVKRSQPGAGQGISEFEREITILSRIRHRHLVSFIGYCNEGLEMILVYEFLEKGTLREHLYNSNFPPLSWKKRLEICIGAAKGLHYLHKGLSSGIIHRDVKSTNILLDENLVAKVSDFGLSTASSLDETHVSTDIKGTIGYLDPEYFRTRQLTQKSDVYSFGVVLLEVLCARLALNPTLPNEQINLAEWGLKCKKMELLEEIIDPKLKGQIDPNSLRKFSETIEKCLQDDGENRPAMGDVVWDLEYALQLEQNVHHRMPHEDSETNANESSSMFIQRIPSIGSSILREEKEHMSQDLDIPLTASQVFSQMNPGEGR